jgi:uncharacterized protein YfaP (DUF2135 family)
MIAGDWTVVVAGEGIITQTFTITISADVDISMAAFRFTITGVLSANMWRAVLTWDMSPRDLDTLLYYPSGELVTYTHKVGSDGKVVLDVDDRDGQGPETLTINFDLTVGVYSYVVYNYSQAPDLKDSSAQVLVYHGSVMSHTFNVSTTTAGAYWWVFNLGAAGLIEVNTMHMTNPFESVSAIYTFSTHIISATSGQIMTGLIGVVCTFTDVGGAIFTASYNSATGAINIGNLHSGLYTVHLETATTIGFNMEFEMTGDVLDNPAFRFALCPAMDADTYRAILTWGSDPADLDTQAYLTDRSGNTEIVTYYNKLSTSQYFTNMVVLDLDDMDGFGPETLTIKDQMTDPNDIVHYTVFDWTGSGNLRVSSARVTLYHGHQLNQIWSVATATGPSTGTQYWYVFDINSNGVVSRNELSVELPTFA